MVKIENSPPQAFFTILVLQMLDCRQAGPHIGTHSLTWEHFCWSGANLHRLPLRPFQVTKNASPTKQQRQCCYFEIKRWDWNVIYVHRDNDVRLGLSVWFITHWLLLSDRPRDRVPKAPRRHNGRDAVQTPLFVNPIIIKGGGRGRVG